ncbi:putative ribonuclease H-like domain-containing protein [Tanacetum coccineum]
MESQSETTQTVAVLKLPILKTGDYDLWSMRMEQYHTHTDYALWEVSCELGIAHASASAEGPIPPKTVEQRLARKNELKAKNTLLLAIPDEHLLKFHEIKDAKSLWEAIKNRFGGNKESKKMQKTILNQLEIHGEEISQEDANLKLLRSLPSAWNNMDDLYNNLKVYEAEIKTSSSTYDDDVMFFFFANKSNSPQLDNEDLEQIDTDDLEEMDLKWQVAMLTMRVKRFIKKTERNLNFNGKETVGFDKTKVKCYNCHMRGHLARECKAPRNQGNKNGDNARRVVPVETFANALVDSYSQKNEAIFEEDVAFLKYDVQVRDISIKDLKNQLEEALKEKDDLKLKLEKFEESSKNLTKLINSQIGAKDKNGFGFYSHVNESEVVHSVFNSRESDVDDSLVNDRFKIDDSVYKTKVSETETSISKTSKDIVEKPKTVRPSAPIIEEWDTDSDNDSVFRPKSDQTKPKFTKINFVKSGKNVKSVNKENTHRQVEYPRKSQSPRDNRRNWNGIRTQKLGNGFESIKKACFVCGSLNHLIKDFLTKSGQVLVNVANQSSNRAAVSVSTARHVNTAAPKSKVNDELPTTYSYFKAHSPIRRSFNQKSEAKTNKRVNTVRINIVTTAGSKAVVNTAEGNPIYALQDQGIFNSGCSRHMTGNNAKGGKITGKGKIRTGKLDFEDVYFMKELKFNLFSVSQMCDKKNSVLFTETECLVLSPDFKLLDESQVLLKIPRQNNMYSFDLKDVVPSGDLTCLFAKATIDESNLWHRRLGHINFKTMNKLVRGNLVRGLPSNLFENDHTCVACQKGKQHKASCKAKTVSSICKPLQLLHMDLFSPVLIRSINKKSYCLVVTDDFSRFSCVFFLATKDETPEILKNFITGIENQIDHKIKTIRCDNGTEFKNRIMNEFCEMKGIRREFSVARTPQQNSVAERKNKTLIEAARTMLANSKLPTTFWSEAVNTACYVQNRVLVIKPHNKTPYELFLGYSINSKAFRVFNTRTIFVEENLHINYLENKPNFAETRPNWMFDIDTLTMSINYQPVFAGNQTNGNACTKANFDAGQAEISAVPGPQYVLLPFLTFNSQIPKSSEDEIADDARKKNGVKDPAKDGDINGPGEDTNINSTNRLNTISSPVNTISLPVNTISLSFTTVDPARARDRKNEFESVFGQDKDANSNYRIFTPVNVVGSSYENLDGSIPVNAATSPNADFPTNPLMPDLEDTANL